MARKALILAAVIIAVSILAATAAAQNAADTECEELTTLHKTICSFGDGTGDVIQHDEFSGSIRHIRNPEEWRKVYAELTARETENLKVLSAELDTERIKIDKDVAELAAQRDKEWADTQQRLAQIDKAHSIRRKKDCTAAGFKWWSSGMCELKDGQ